MLEAKKVREVAEQDATKKIMDHVSPIIKKMIMKEAAESSKFLFGEDDSEPGIVTDPFGGTNPGDLSTSGEIPGQLPNGSPGLEQAPISPKGELGGMPMPDNEGKITLDFEQLFNMTGAAGGSQGAQGLIPNAQPLDSIVADTGAMATPPSEEAPINAPISGTLPPGAESAPLPQTEPASTPGMPAPLPPTPENQLPAPTPEGEDETLPQPTLAEKVELFHTNVIMVAEKIDNVISKGINSSTLVKESIKAKLFSLCENVDVLVAEGTFNEKQAKIVENKLDFLYSKLNEANDPNSYKKDEGKNMTTLKEFAAKLFEEDALGPVLTPKATAHAEKVSGVAPGVDLFKEGEEMSEEELTEALLGEAAPASTAFGDGTVPSGAQTKSPKVAGKSLASEKGAAGIAESAPASTAFGDGSKATGAETASPDVHDASALADKTGNHTILEFDEKELKEAIARVRKENFARKLASVKEEALKGTDAKGHLKTPKVPEGEQSKTKPEGKAVAQPKEIKEEFDIASLTGGDDASDMSADLDVDADNGGSGEVELKFQIDIDDLEALLSGGVADFIAEPTSADMGSDMAPETDVGDDDASDTIEISDDSDEPEEVLTDASASDEVEEEETLMEMKKQLSESKLLTAKALYVSKFAVREDLTSKQKQKIAGYFDATKSLAEAKDTYGKIKKILSESASTNNLSGSASRPTTTGRANSINEGVDKSPDMIEPSRWMLLAGIGKKNPRN